MKRNDEQTSSTKLSKTMGGSVMVGGGVSDEIVCPFGSTLIGM